MVALVQYEYLRKLMNTHRMYPKFLTAMLRDDYMEEQSEAAARGF